MHLFRIFVVAAALTAVAAAPASGAPPRLPHTPVGSQITWALAQLDGDARTLTVDEVEAHYAPSFLAGLPAPVIVKLMRQVASQLGPARYEGLAGTATRRSAIALITTRSGMKLAVYATVAGTAPHRITGFDITERPGPGAAAIATPGPYTGLYPVGGGRQLFLNCSGDGSPTVLLEAGAGGGAAAWRSVQRRISRSTRVCSYDRANVPGGSSSFAPKPQTAADIVRDLHRAVVAAGVPGPYVLAGHSNGGLYARLFAMRYADDTAGLVLVDSVSETLPARERALFRRLLPPKRFREYLAQSKQKPRFVPYIGDEQVDIDASYRELRAAAAKAPLRPMPLIVIAHGIGNPVDENGVKGLRAGVERMWQDSQRWLAALVPGGRYVVARGSHHDIPAERPKLVADSILDVVREVR